MGETAGARCARIYGPPSGLVVRNAERPATADGALVEGLHRAGYSWLEIAEELGVSHQAVVEAARWRGLTEHGQRRHTLPPGHPRTWNMLNAGLATLDGTRYGDSRW